MRYLRNTSIITALFCFILSAIYITKVVYVYGAPADAAIISNIMWHNIWNVYYPYSVNSVANAHSYYQSHTSFIFAPISWMSYLLPLNMIQYSIFILSLSVGFTGFVSVELLKNFFKNKFVVVIFALAITFNFYNYESIRSFHFEIFYAAFLGGFLFFYFANKKNLSYFFLLLFLISREDFGFHLFTLLATIIVFNLVFIKDMRLKLKEISKIALIAFFSSIILCYLKKFFPGDNAFSRVYFSTEWPEILNFFHPTNIFKSVLRPTKNNMFLGILLGIYFIFVLRTKKLSLLIPFVSIIPWYLIHVVSPNRNAYLIVDYYVFPFVIILIWPAIDYLIFSDANKKIVANLKFLQAILILFSLGNSLNLYGNLFPLYPDNVFNTGNFSKDLNAFTIDNNGSFKLTEKIAFHNVRLFQGSDLSKGGKKEHGKNSFFYIYPEYESYRYLKSYKNHYLIKDTPVRISSDLNFHQLSKYFRNLEINKKIWLESLSLSKKQSRDYIQRPCLKIDPKKLVRKPIVLNERTYKATISQVGDNESKFEVMNYSDGEVLFSNNLSGIRQSFEFNIPKNGDYSFAIKPANKNVCIAEMLIE